MKRKTKKDISKIMNWIVVSDCHCGCKVGLCPPEDIPLDEGGFYKPSKFQRDVWTWWEDFWNVWVPKACRGEPFGIILNGDTLDGVHHGSVHQISHNLADQAYIANLVLRPLVKKCDGFLFMIRGTEAHVGKSAQEEERLARELGAIPNELGQHARYELWKKIGDALVHILHHIGTTGSQAYEATAVHKELVESFTEAGRWGNRPPDIIVRSHRHRFMKTEIPTHKGHAIAVVTPAWQGKTPFTWKIPGARLTVPQIGGICLRQGDEEFYVRHKVYTMARSKVE